jgi:hypothetical protein
LTWTAWSQTTGKQQRVTVTGVDREGSCVEAITLATSFKPDPPSDGLAFDRPTTVEAVVELEQSSPEWDVLRRVLFDVSAKGVRKLTSADVSGC